MQNIGTPITPIVDTLSSLFRKSWDKYAKSLGWRKQVLRLPRACCRWIRIDLTGVPLKLQSSSIRLQLMQLSGIAKPGFAWRVAENFADVWYWDELALQAQGVIDTHYGDRYDPIPESLFRMPCEQGLYLVSCSQGYECLALDNRGVRKTRWFHDMPSEEAWQSFVRDAGLNPAMNPLPGLMQPVESDPIQLGWKICSAVVAGKTPGYWAAAVTLVIAGVVVAYALAYTLRLAWATHQLSTEYRQLAQENAELISLTARIADTQDFLAALKSIRPANSQLLLMKNLVETGVLGEASKISLLEWEYRNGRLRLLIAVPAEDFSLSLFLSALERQEGFADVRLLPDTPPATVGVQLSVGGASATGTGGVKK